MRRIRADEKDRHDAKYPLVSRIRSVVLVTYALTDPFAPAGTIAAFDTMLPSNAFSVDTVGCPCPAGHKLRKDSAPGSAYPLCGSGSLDRTTALPRCPARRSSR